MGDVKQCRDILPKTKMLSRDVPQNCRSRSSIWVSCFAHKICSILSTMTMCPEDLFCYVLLKNFVLVQRPAIPFNFIMTSDMERHIFVGDFMLAVLSWDSGS